MTPVAHSVSHVVTEHPASPAPLVVQSKSSLPPPSDAIIPPRPVPLVGMYRPIIKKRMVDRPYVEAPPLPVHSFSSNGYSS